MVMAKAFIDYHPMEMEWDAGYMRSQLIHIIASDIFLVSEVDGKLVGGIGGKILPNLWSPKDVHLVEMFWWVDPKWRKGMLGLRLMDAFEEVGKIKEANSVVMVSTNLTPQLGKLYERRGYTMYEETYRKDI
jgi:hypothetical protein